MPHEVATVMSVIGWFTVTNALPLKSAGVDVAVSPESVVMV